jgi:hypothetical protein
MNMMFKNLPYCVGLLGTLAGCVHTYHPPRANEPHALVKIRRVYEQHTGASLEESVNVGEDSALTLTVGTSSSFAPRIDAIFVRPEPTIMTVSTGFYHTEIRTETETYQELVPGSKTESYDCGTFDAPNTCTRTVDDSHYETRTRTVDRQYSVDDGSCQAALSFQPAVDGVYLISYTYRSPKTCNVSCYRQTKADDGSLRNARCETPAR